MKKIIAALVLAAAAIVATPMAANATGYVSGSSITITGSTIAGGTTIINIAPGAFVNDENVNIYVTGAGAVTLGALPTTTVHETKQATATGALNVSVKLPEGASGTYSLTATGVTSGNVATAALSVSPAAGTAATSSDGSLAFTGSTVPMLLVWSAGGAIVLGGGMVLVMGARRRQRNTI
jgi:hypothetical protein